jgi:hypothetical protein
MRLSLSTRAWTWIGAVALVLTAGLMLRRTSGAAPAAPEELRDAVASPAPLAGPRAMPRSGAFSVPPRPRPALSRRLSRLADALDAKAASLRAAR